MLGVLGRQRASSFTAKHPKVINLVLQWLFSCQFAFNLDDSLLAAKPCKKATFHILYHMHIIILTHSYSQTGKKEANCLVYFVAEVLTTLQVKWSFVLGFPSLYFQHTCDILTVLCNHFGWIGQTKEVRRKKVSTSNHYY
jgi:hypothetical protein